MKIVRPLLTLIGALTVAGTLASAVLFFFAPVLLQQEDSLEKADTIVVLGGQYFRPIYAAELYNEGYAPKLLVSKPIVYTETQAVRKLDPTFPYQWEVFKKLLLAKGVPEKDFSFFGSANVSTVEEAEELAKIISPNIKSLIIVTSPLHTRRAGIIFRKELPQSTKIIMTSPPYDTIPKQWWKNYRTAPYVLLEIAKTLYYELGGAFRSTEQITN